ncbi:IPT/TIG domain-containing protein [Arthrobacter alpinus]|uniref:IPT/TIG domain-containing protein n=1 Tax=Arthrobacter alpinus TaxID=656366 RepID=A0A1H5HFF1_9MICC|nr:IPT/TIG domain-containing protein [Arthrobacter alpinus]SEE26630.1 IPT/TIG domain-containing protein [Arthrobacter alpinus]
MAKDSKGNDVSAVGIPVTGRMGFAPEGTAGPTPSEGAVIGFTLDPAYQVPGLLTDDGGPEWTLEADGDPVEFWQEGYTLPSGLAKAEVSQTYAQTDETVRSIIRGQVADENGYMTIDAGGTDTKYSMFSEEIFKNGTIRRRWAPDVNVLSVKEVKSKRGDVMGYETTYKINRSDLVGGKHFGEWLILPGGVVVSISTATPADAAAAATVTITGTGFTGTTAVKFGASNATSFAVVSNTSITAVMPAGSAGSAQITVTTPSGNATFAYNRG